MARCLAGFPEDGQNVVDAIRPNDSGGSNEDQVNRCGPMILNSTLPRLELTDFKSNSERKLMHFLKHFVVLLFVLYGLNWRLSVKHRSRSIEDAWTFRRCFH